MEAIIAIGVMAATAAAIIKMHDWNAKREFEERKAAVLAVAKEELEARGEVKYENPKPIKLYNYQKDLMAKMIKFIRQREEEEKKIRKWQHYAKHAKKWRVRKKYQKKIQENYAKKEKPMFLHPKCGHFPLVGNWPYGSGAGLFPRPYLYPEGGRRP